MAPIIALIGLGQMGCAYAKYASSLTDKLICYDIDACQRDSFKERAANNKNPFDKIEHKASLKNIEIVDNINSIWDKKPLLTIITTHKDSHCYYSVSAMENNSHVLVEKPLCLNLQETNKIAESSLLTKKHLYIGFSLHQTPAFIALKQIIRTGLNIRKYSVYRIGVVPEDYKDRVTARFDLLSHDTDFCRQLFGIPHRSFVNEINNRECHKTWVYPSFQVEMSGKMPYSHPNGFEYGYKLITDDNTVIQYSSKNAREILKNTSNGVFKRIEINEKSPCKAILESTVKSIREDTYEMYLEHELSIKQGVNCMNLLINDEI